MSRTINKHLTNHQEHDIKKSQNRRCALDSVGRMNRVVQDAVRDEADSQPIYNMKAVVEATGLPAATLRAWERRYSAVRPARTESGYRLYSANDVALLRWLKARLDEGVNISQAIALLNRHTVDEPAPRHGRRRRESNSGLNGTRDELVAALLQFDEPESDRVLNEAFAIYGLEAAGEHVLAPVMAQIGDLWHQDKASAAAEHFASNYLRRKLDSFISAAPPSSDGPPIVLGCAPNDWHELSVLLLYLLLRRRGFNTIYLGQNVPLEQFVEEMARLGPAMVIISANSARTVQGLVDLAQAVESMPFHRPLFAYCGRIFSTHPELRADMPGIFLGESARSAAGYITQLLSLDGRAALPRSADGLRAAEGLIKVPLTASTKP